MNALLSLIKHKDDDDYDVIHKIYLHIKDPNEAKYQYLIRKQKIDFAYYKYPETLIEFLNNMQEVNKSIDEYNLGNIQKILLLFDDMISDMVTNIIT